LVEHDLFRKTGIHFSGSCSRIERINKRRHRKSIGGGLLAAPGCFQRSLDGQR